MKQEFEQLAQSLEVSLRGRFGTQTLRSEPFYREFERLIQEWNSGSFSTGDTFLGIAAAKLFDSGLPEDNKIKSDLARLAYLFSRRASGVK